MITCAGQAKCDQSTRSKRTLRQNVGISRNGQYLFSHSNELIPAPSHILELFLNLNLPKGIGVLKQGCACVQGARGRVKYHSDPSLHHYSWVAPIYC